MVFTVCVVDFHCVDSDMVVVVMVMVVAMVVVIMLVVAAEMVTVVVMTMLVPFRILVNGSRVLEVWSWGSDGIT